MSWCASSSKSPAGDEVAVDFLAFFFFFFLDLDCAMRVWLALDDSRSFDWKS